jgi:peptidoglycan/xylan/chitin deacetylase (PgdA/CDA1 family)
MEVVAKAERPWPAGCLGAISLTFDDGRASHLARVLPVLEDLGLRGTFYLNPRGATDDEWRARLEPWQTVQAAGHEIGNHSLSHVCSRAHRDRPDPRVPVLETWTLADVEADVLEAERRLRAVLGPPPGGARTFCYPCYHEHVGEGPTRQSYVPVIARHFLAARGRGESGDNHPATCDLHYLWSWNVEHLDGPALVGRAERASLGMFGTWVILTFHDVGEGRRSNLFNTEPAFRELCEFLARHRDRLWTAPVVEVARHIIAWRSSPRRQVP